MDTVNCTPRMLKRNCYNKNYCFELQIFLIMLRMIRIGKRLWFVVNANVNWHTQWPVVVADQTVCVSNCLTTVALASRKRTIRDIQKTVMHFLSCKHNLSRTHLEKIKNINGFSFAMDCIFYYSFSTPR